MLRGMAIIDYSWQKKKKKKNKFYSDSDWSALHFLCFSRFIHLIRLYSLCFHCTPRTTILIGQECTLAVVRTLHYCTVLRGRILIFLFSISYFLFSLHLLLFLFLAHPFSHVTVVVTVGFTFVALVVVTVLLAVVDCLRTRLFVFLFLHVMGLVFIGYPL